jgi:hypothetical protein
VQIRSPTNYELVDAQCPSGESRALKKDKFPDVTRLLVLLANMDRSSCRVTFVTDDVKGAGRDSCVAPRRSSLGALSDAHVATWVQLLDRRVETARSDLRPTRPLRA